MASFQGSKETIIKQITKGNTSARFGSAIQVLPSRLFKSFEFGNGNTMSDENLAILEFKYLQNKKWYKQAVKSARIKKSYRTY